MEKLIFGWATKGSGMEKSLVVFSNGWIQTTRGRQSGVTIMTEETGSATVAVVLIVRLDQKRWKSCMRWMVR